MVSRMFFCEDLEAACQEHSGLAKIFPKSPRLRRDTCVSTSIRACTTVHTCNLFETKRRNYEGTPFSPSFSFNASPSILDILRVLLRMLVSGL